jgi:regulator of extracellular matrix RemA (YlzA/DUF370 family)
VWQRTFVALGGGVFVIIDRVRTEAKTYNVLLHLAPDLKTAPIDKHRYAISGEGRSVEIFQASNAKFSTRVSSGDEGFPRGLITTGLGSSVPSQVLFAEVSAKDSWVLTVISDVTTEGLMVHSLYSGKIVRVFVPGEASKVIDCNIDDPSVPVRMYSYRSHRGSH